MKKGTVAKGNCWRELEKLASGIAGSTRDGEVLKPLQEALKLFKDASRRDDYEAYSVQQFLCGVCTLVVKRLEGTKETLLKAAFAQR